MGFLVIKKLVVSNWVEPFSPMCVTGCKELGCLLCGAHLFAVTEMGCLQCGAHLFAVRSWGVCCVELIY